MIDFESFKIYFLCTLNENSLFWYIFYSFDNTVGNFLVLNGKNSNDQFKKRTWKNTIWLDLQFLVHE